MGFVGNLRHRSDLRALKRLCLQAVAEHGPWGYLLRLGHRSFMDAGDKSHGRALLYYLRCFTPFKPTAFPIAAPLVHVPGCLATTALASLEIAALWCRLQSLRVRHRNDSPRSPLF